jgi:hypothetical protein
MKITNLDRVSLKVLRASIDEALKAVGEKHGISIQTGNGSYDPRGKSAVLKLELNVLGEDGVAYSPLAEDFKRNAPLYGLKPEFLNETFTDSRGKTYKLVGFDVKRRSKPFVIECTTTGKTYIAPGDMLQRGFKDRLPSKDSAPQPN